MSELLAMFLNLMALIAVLTAFVAVLTAPFWIILVIMVAPDCCFFTFLTLWSMGVVACTALAATWEAWMETKKKK